MTSEWLETRRKLEKDWVNALKGVHLKLKEIIESCKAKKYAKIDKFLEEKEQDLNFLDLQKLFELLKETPEADQKTFLGGYASPILKNVTALIKLMEKKNFNMADLGKQLSLLTNFVG